MTSDLRENLHVFASYSPFASAFALASRVQVQVVVLRERK